VSRGAHKGAEDKRSTRHAERRRKRREAVLAAHKAGKSIEQTARELDCSTNTIREDQRALGLRGRTAPATGAAPASFEGPAFVDLRDAHGRAVYRGDGHRWSEALPRSLTRRGVVCEPVGEALKWGR